LTNHGETTRDGFFVEKLSFVDTEYRVKSTDTENRSNSHVLYKHVTGKKLGRIHAMYKTSYNQSRAFIHCYDKFDSTQVYPKAALPLLEDYHVIPINDLIDICVVVPAEYCIYMTPVRSDYLYLKPVSNWQEKYANVENEIHGPISQECIQQMLNNLEEDPQNFTYPKP
jgi:hypothetical protein